jgi:hypothetical protein
MGVISEYGAGLRAVRLRINSEGHLRILRLAEHFGPGEKTHASENKALPSKRIERDTRRSLIRKKTRISAKRVAEIIGCSEKTIYNCGAGTDKLTRIRNGRWSSSNWFYS